MDDEIGSVMMDVEEELVMPEIPIRPNTAIPAAVGVMMIIGGLMVAYAAFNAFVMNEMFSADDEEQLANQFSDTGAEITPEDINQYDDNFSSSAYRDWNGFLFTASALSLIGGGVQLYRGIRRGVKTSLSGAGRRIISNVWGSMTSQEAASHLPEVAQLTFVTMYYIYACCGLFCLSSAALPMMFASGRAALSTPTKLQSQEEE